MKNRPRPHRPNRAERRAKDWVNQSAMKVISQEGTITLPSPIAFTVRRGVLLSTPGGILERSDVMNLLINDHGLKTFDDLSISLITPGEARKVADRWDREPSLLRQKLEKASKALPTTLSGFVIRAAILGVWQNKNGSRYVGCTFDTSLQTTLQQERSEVIQGLGEADIIGGYNYKPHLTLYETKDQARAEAICKKLALLVNNTMIPIQLSPVEVIPIANKQQPGIINPL